MSNFQNQSIYPVTKELNYIDLHNVDEKQENPTFITTVRRPFDEMDQLENKHQGPATIVAEEENTNSNICIDQGEKDKILKENKNQKAEVQNMLVSNSLQNMINNIQGDSNTELLLARDIDIPLTMRETITAILDDMLSKVNDVWYFQSEKQSNDTAIPEIEVEVCTKRREISFWEKTKSTSLNLVTLFLPSELLNDKGESNNDTLPF